MVEADRCHGSDDIVTSEDIGGVDPATDARFDDEPVGAGPSRHHQGDCGGQSKEGRWFPDGSERLGVGSDLLDGGDNLLPRRQFIGHHEALTDVVHVGRLVESDRPTRRSERGSDKAGNSALAGGTDDMHRPNPVLWVVHPGQQLRRREPGPLASRRVGLHKAKEPLLDRVGIGRHHRRTTLSAPCAPRYPWIPPYGTVPPYRTVLDGDS